MGRSSNKPSKEPRQPDYVAEKQSPNYRSKQVPRAEEARECHPVNPPGTPSSAAENHEDANQKCNTAAPQTASKDEREKAVG
jgi:hypothetical protein